ncbi:MAG: pilin [Endozoicomonadaceae bacterium]|nr:pilin [Endozoicomonadaceae bacterium]
MSEGLGLAAGAKAGVADYYAVRGGFPDNNGTAGLDENITGNAVDSIEVGASGIITITYNSAVHATNNKLTLTPTPSSGSLTWKCTADENNNGVPHKYLPALCRQSSSP